MSMGFDMRHRLSFFLIWERFTSIIFHELCASRLHRPTISSKFLKPIVDFGCFNEWFIRRVLFITTIHGSRFFFTQLKISPSSEPSPECFPNSSNLSFIKRWVILLLLRFQDGNPGPSGSVNNPSPPFQKPFSRFRIRGWNDRNFVRQYEIN